MRYSVSFDDVVVGGFDRLSPTNPVLHPYRRDELHLRFDGVDAALRAFSLEHANDVFSRLLIADEQTGKSWAVEHCWFFDQDPEPLRSDSDPLICVFERPDAIRRLS